MICTNLGVFISTATRLWALTERVALTALVETTASDKTPKDRSELNFVRCLIWALLRPSVFVRNKAFPFPFLVYFWQFMEIINILYDTRMQSRIHHAKRAEFHFGQLYQIHHHSLSVGFIIFSWKTIASSHGNRYISGSFRLYAAYDAGSLI